jgi:hypothetical protein
MDSESVRKSSCHSRGGVSVSAIKPYEGFGVVEHTIKELMSL